MKPYRTESVYISEKLRFYAHILAKAKCNGTQGDLTIDNLVDAELIDKWEKEFPQLQAAWERNNALRQQNKKAYAENEAEVVRAISPVPGAKLIDDKNL